MYTFASWVSTPENRSAATAVRRVVEAVGAQRRWPEAAPLFLHGPAGTGKTHLVTALAAEVSRLGLGLSAVLLSASEFAELSRTAQEAQPEHPSNLTALRDADLLVVEDVQHLPARAADALARLLDARLAHRHQTVFTASVGPALLIHLPARLTSRLASGLVISLAPLSPASRLAFLQDRAARRQVAVAPEALELLAEHVSGSARQLEGALSRLETLARLNGRMPGAAELAEHFGGAADRRAGRQLLPGAAAADAVAATAAAGVVAAAGRHVPGPAADAAVAGTDRRLVRRPRPQHRSARLPQGRAGPGPRRGPVRGSTATPRGPGMTSVGENLLTARQRPVELR